MAHPIETIKENGKIWHLEDTVPKSDAEALKRHLIHTEEKKAKIKKLGRSYQVWWAKK